MHFYKFHIGDYMSHTRHLSHYEDLAYRRLLDFYFLHEQPIRHRDAARHIGMRDHEEDVLTVLNEFFLSTENGFVNVRADKEISEFRKHQAVSAFGAFVRDNPSLKEIASKEDFIFHYLDNSIDEYISSLRVNDVPIKDTSSGDDAPLTTNHKPLTTNHVKEKATSVACPDSVSQQVWDDWMTVRKEKKAKTLTETGWNQFVKQVEKAGWTLEQAISHCCLKQWVGFEAAWVLPKPNPADIARVTVPPSKKADEALIKILEDEKKAAPIPDSVREYFAKNRRQA